MQTGKWTLVFIPHKLWILDKPEQLYKFDAITVISSYPFNAFERVKNLRQIDILVE